MDIQSWSENIGGTLASTQLSGYKAERTWQMLEVQRSSSHHQTQNVPSGKNAKALLKTKNESYMGYFRAVYLLAILKPRILEYVNRAVKLRDHLSSMKTMGALTDAEIEEVESQFSILELHRETLVSHKGEIVVVYNSQLFFGTDLNSAIDEVKKKYGSIDKPYYSESIDVVDFPSIFG
jgi:hypothetical protein